MDYYLFSKYKKIFDGEKDTKKLLVNVLSGKSNFNFNEFVSIYNEGDRKFLYSIFNENGKSAIEYCGYTIGETYYIEDVKYLFDENLNELNIFYDKENKEIIIEYNFKYKKFPLMIAEITTKSKIIINDINKIKEFIDVMMKDFEEFRNIIDEYAGQYDELSDSLDKKSDLEIATDTAVNIVGGLALATVEGIIKMLDENN
ncbi:hypothetical protein [uncultured Sneathia sp.]|uniref:hypothetical protein n=1 Tax=uncultured Sneathia sp. TaxID=278067 RepID=UPI0025965572|nr:hypothetical protein [uncultured Sneathia sp.]